MEEASVEVDLKGILAFDHYLEPSNNSVWMRVIYYAEPKDPNVIPKQIPDDESVEARWVTIDEFKNLDNIRGDELIEHGEYIENGG